MSAVMPFTYGDREMRTVLVDGEPRFVVADAAALLGYRDAANAARLLRESQLGYSVVSTPGGTQRMLVTNESGLNRLILRSNRPEAEQIQEWVEDDVLPAIRRTGAYQLPAKAERPMDELEMARCYVAAVERERALKAQVTELAPSARAWDQLADDALGDYSVREAAQILDRDPAIRTGQGRLFATLVAIGWLDSRKQPYQRHIDNGRLVRRLRDFTDKSTGDRRLADPQVRITVKGLADLHRKLGGVGPTPGVPALELVAGGEG